MTTQHIKTNSIGSGQQIDLSTTDDLLIDAGVTVKRTDVATGFLSGLASVAIGTGSGHDVTVNGSLIGANSALWLGGDINSDASETVTVGADGKISALNNNAINLLAFDSSIDNAGKIVGKYDAILMEGNSGGSSDIHNAGLIKGSQGAGIVREGSEDLTIVNTGTIQGGTAAFDAHGGTGVDTFSNKGAVIGDVQLGGGNDVFNTKNGTVDGTVYGQDGDDKLTGGDGTNNLVGGAGADTLKGGGGADHFIFNTTQESHTWVSLDIDWSQGFPQLVPTFYQGDTIVDFNHNQHDKIDLTGIDAKTSTMTNDAFNFIGNGAFSGTAGELRYELVDGNTVVSADTNGDGNADFDVTLNGAHIMHGSDFNL